MKYIKQLSLTLLLLITAATGAWAQGPWTSGSCTLTLNNGTLTVSGNGAMADYQFFSDRPWHNNRSDITSVVVESGVTTVGRNAFFNFDNLTSVTLPEGLTAIGVSAFRVCGKLTSVTIPSTVTSIGNDAFYSCAGMTDVNLYADPANLTWDENNDDFKENKATKCHVLDEHLSAYQTKFGSSVNVTFVGDLQPLPGTMNLNSDKTTASFTMPANDVTVNYTLVRDMQDQANPVAFSGLPTTTGGSIIVKKGSDGKYQPAEELNIQLIDPLAAEDAKNIIAADGITIKVLVGNGGTPIEYDQENPITLEAFLADMKPGYYWIKAEATDENSPYEGTVYSSEFTVVEQYDLTVKPADDFSKNGLDAVTVGSESVTIDANTGKATKTGITPDTEVKLKAKRGYVIESVEAKKIVPAEGHDLTASAVGDIVGSDGKTYAAADKDNLPKNVTAVAMVAYKNGTGGLAIALSDEGSMNFSTAKSTCASKTAISGATWQLPSKNQWEQIFSANGGNNNSCTGLNTAIDNAGGTALVAGNVYWTTSSAMVSGTYFCLIINNGGSISSQTGSPGKNKMTRAILTF